jgi:hypothetical protein
MLYPKEYEHFSFLVKRYVELTLLLKIIPFDVRQLQQSKLKFIRCYDRLLEEVSLQIGKDLSILKRELNATGGVIVSEKQEKTFRLVQSKFKGFSYQQRFSNEVLRSDCEKLLALYMKGPFSLDLIKKRGG